MHRHFPIVTVLVAGCIAESAEPRVDWARDSDEAPMGEGMFHVVPLKGLDEGSIGTFEREVNRHFEDGWVMETYSTYSPHTSSALLSDTTTRVDVLAARGAEPLFRAINDKLCDDETYQLVTLDRAYDNVGGSQQAVAHAGRIVYSIRGDASVVAGWMSQYRDAGITGYRNVIARPAGSTPHVAWLAKGREFRVHEAYTAKQIENLINRDLSRGWIYLGYQFHGTAEHHAGVIIGKLNKPPAEPQTTGELPPEDFSPVERVAVVTARTPHELARAANGLISKEWPPLQFYYTGAGTVVWFQVAGKNDLAPRIYHSAAAIDDALEDTELPGAALAIPEFLCNCGNFISTRNADAAGVMILSGRPKFGLGIVPMPFLTVGKRGCDEVTDPDVFLRRPSDGASSGRLLDRIGPMELLDVPFSGRSDEPAKEAGQ